MNKNIFCYAPWSNIEILPTGSILPCCKFQDQYYQERFNIVTDSIEDYFRSESLIQIKQDFVSGRWPAGCERCKIEEASNIPSKRQLDYERWQSYYEKYDFETDSLLTVSLALGNTCNLKCIMCNPAASSTWSKEYEDLYKIKIPSLTRFRKNNLDDLLKLSQHIVHIDIHGGEPFLSNEKDHVKFLDFFIKNKRAAEISLHYTTNGTVCPDTSLQSRWNHFRAIDLQISIDGVADRFEYIRYPAVWDTLQKNVNQYLEYQLKEQTFSISIAHTVSAYNIFYLDEFFAWCKQTGLPIPWMGKLHRPAHLRSSIWPEPARTMIIDRLLDSANQEVLNWADHIRVSNDSDYFVDFVAYTTRHDQYRGIDFRRTFPELARFI